MMNKIARCTLCAQMLLATGCGGRPANPVMIQQYGDIEKSCDSLEREMNLIQSQISVLSPQKAKTHTNNVVLVICGAFLLWPLLFFIDTNKSEEIEINAFQQRLNYLMSIAASNGCLTAARKGEG